MLNYYMHTIIFLRRSMTDAIIEFFRNFLDNDILTIFIISMLPIVELRGSIPIAIQMGLEWHVALGYAFLGSISVVPILLLILMPILNFMKKNRLFKKIADVVESMFKGKAESITKRIGTGDTERRELVIKMLGVLAFVAIPVPLTGVWTGTAVALFLGLGYWKSLLVVSIGNMSAGLIMTGLSVLLQDHLNIFLTVFMAVVLILLVANIAYAVIKSHVKKKKAAGLVSEENEIDTIKSDDTKVNLSIGEESNNASDRSVDSVKNSFASRADDAKSNDDIEVSKNDIIAK